MSSISSRAGTRTRVKICGLTRSDDVHAAVAAGVDSIGLVFHARSARNLELHQAAALACEIPAFVSLTALFLNPDERLVESVLNKVRPEILQFHGQEDAAFCSAFGRRYIKAVAMGGSTDELARTCERHPDACGYLLDSHAPGDMGGSGTPFDWTTLDESKLPLILAGGLKPENVGQAIEQVRPWAVDVSSGVEQAPGLKSADKIHSFLAAVRAADAVCYTRDV